MRGLPVSVLLGRDCALFHSYWRDGPRPGHVPQHPRRVNQVACIASPESEGEVPSARHRTPPVNANSGTLTTPKGTPEESFSDFQPDQEPTPHTPHYLWQGSVGGPQPEASLESSPHHRWCATQPGEYARIPLLCCQKYVVVSPVPGLGERGGPAPGASVAYFQGSVSHPHPSTQGPPRDGENA